MNRQLENIRNNECDVIGQMCISNSANMLLRKGILPTDFCFEDTRKLYSEILKLADRVGNFDVCDLLGDKKRFTNLIYMMESCVSTNLDVKCDWIIKLSIQRARL
jgi:replicative DNA helicase